MRVEPSLQTLSDDELLRRLSEILRKSRADEADLVEHLAEVDARRLYTREAAPSMYAYCTERLHLSEAEAWLRIRVARASRKHPMLLPMLRDGRLHVSAIVVLAPHLTPENRQGLLKRAVHRSKRQIEELVAEIAPQEDAPARVRKLPARQGTAPSVPARQLTPDTVERPDSLVRSPAPTRGPDAGPARSATVEPLAPARFKVQFTTDTELRDMLEHLQALMRSSVPDGDLAAILKIAVAEKIERLEAKRFARTKAPRKALADTDTTPRSRHIPAAVRRIVHERDEGRCTYRDKHGRRCSKRHDLEFHHRKPFLRGGEHSPEVLTLHCRAHNALVAEQDYGKEVMARHRRSERRPPNPVAVSGEGRSPSGVDLPHRARERSRSCPGPGPGPSP